MEKKDNRIVCFLLMIFITVLIIVNFLFSDSRFCITFEIIICISFLVILCVSESFDNLSIPKLLSLSKNIKDVKKENAELKETNYKLLEQVVNVKNSNSQNIYLPNSFSTIGSSSIEDLNKKVDSDPSIQEENTAVNKHQNENEYRLMATQRSKYRRNIEIFILKKALQFDKNVHDDDIKYDVKLINNFDNDNIMKNEINFDAMKFNGIENIFYEVYVSPILYDFSFQLHYMLRTLELYEEFTKTPCKLVLILPKIDEELEKIMFNSVRNRFVTVKDRILKKFMPAIDRKLLEIVEIDVEKKEFDQYIINVENNK